MKQVQTFEGVCEKHGPFTGKRMRLFGQEITSGCPVCSREMIEADKRAREEALNMASRGYDLAQSNIPPRFQQKSLDSFMASTAEQQKAAEIVAAYLKDWPEHRERGEGLVFLGRPGTGKTHLACGIGVELCKRGQTVLYVKAAELMRRIKATYGRDSKETENGIYRELLGYDLLIIDEVGRQVGGIGHTVPFVGGGQNGSICLARCHHKVDNARQVEFRFQFIAFFL